LARFHSRGARLWGQPGTLGLRPQTPRWPRLVTTELTLAKFLKALGAILAGVLLVTIVTQSTAGQESWRWAVTSGSAIGIIIRWVFAFGRNSKLTERSIINSGLIGGGLLSAMVAYSIAGTPFEAASALGTGAVTGLLFGAGVALTVVGFRSTSTLWAGLERNQHRAGGTSDVSQAIRGWHRGQLILFWIGHLFIAWLLYEVVSESYLTTWPPFLAWSLVFVLFVAIPASLIAATWIWFGGAQRQ
jgi:hypothetical protein